VLLLQTWPVEVAGGSHGWLLILLLLLHTVTPQPRSQQLVLLLLLCHAKCRLCHDSQAWMQVAGLHSCTLISCGYEVLLLLFMLLLLLLCLLRGSGCCCAAAPVLVAVADKDLSARREFLSCLEVDAVTAQFAVMPRHKS